MIPWHADEMREHDRGIVFGSWKASYRESPFGDELVKRFGEEVYIDHMQAKIERLLARSRVLIARPDGWPEGVLAWVCAQQLPDVFVVHYAFSKRRMRKRVTGESLCDALIERFEPHGQRVISSFRPPFSRKFTNHGYDYASEYASPKEGP